MEFQEVGRAVQPALRVGIVVTPQFTLNALANFVDVLRLASDDGDRSRPMRCRWNIMSASGAPIRASCGFQLVPTSSFIDFAKLDYVAVIGGLLHLGRQIHVEARSYLLRASEAGVGLLGICTGTFVLCRLGLMRNKKCCVSWYHYRDFIEEFDDLVPVADELYVVDDDRITSAGGVGAALTAAYLVDRHVDSASAQKALHIMQIDLTKSRAESQPAPPVTSACDDECVRRALHLMEQNINTPVSVNELATRLRISRRTLERLFDKHMRLSPLTVYLKLRLRYARWMLRSRKSLWHIAVDTGFTDSSHLCAAFKRMYGHTPSEERRRSGLNVKSRSLQTHHGEERRVFGFG